MFRRIAIIATGTVGGVAAVVAYHPPSLSPVTTVGVVSPVPTATGTKTPPATATTTSKAGVFAGDTAQTAWGPVQVQITVSGGQITGAKALQWPNGDRRSQSIAQQSIPYLIQ